MNTIERTAQTLGLFVSAWGPGDGVTRYKFHIDVKGFFESDGVFTALGKREALVFLRGVEIGKLLEAKIYERISK